MRTPVTEESVATIDLSGYEFSQTVLRLTDHGRGMMTPSLAGLNGASTSVLVSEARAPVLSTVGAGSVRSRALFAPFVADSRVFRCLPYRTLAYENAVTSRNAYVEVGGVEPAATPFREFPFRLLNAYWPCSEHVFGLTRGNPSLPFGAFKPRQVRVTASLPRHVSVRTIGVFRCHVPWPNEGVVIAHRSHFSRR